MRELIDKAVVAAEIKRRINGLKDCHADTIEGYAGEISGLERLFSFIDTLEVKKVDFKKENLWKPADGDDLPETDREVIALLNNSKVVFAHRPIQFTTVTHLTTGKQEKIEAMLYGKGGWNQPNVKWWLDLNLPK